MNHWAIVKFNPAKDEPLFVLMSTVTRMSTSASFQPPRLGHGYLVSMTLTEFTDEIGVSTVLKTCTANPDGSLLCVFGERDQSEDPTINVEVEHKCHCDNAESD